MSVSGAVAAGFLASAGLGLLLGRAVIARLQNLGARQTVSDDAPARHAGKQGTPTMGGLLILLALAVPALVLVALRPDQRSLLALLTLTLCFGLIGFTDDLLIARRGRNLGLLARQKLALQFVVATSFVWWLHVTHVPLTGGTTLVRLGAATEIDLGSWYYGLAVLLIVGMSNAVNLADGLDGLAGGVCLIVALVVIDAVNVFGYLEWVPAFAAMLAGACAGFLWFNAHPAEVFMGDTGSLALGASLAGLAILGKAEAPLMVGAAVPIAEAASVVAQVAVFRYRRSRRGIEYAREHRLFRRTPLHHHFEEIGWSETKIVMRFWLATAAAAMLAAVLFGAQGR
jgi:phospho-N-acetylmuramoyl-pentapeptide-transferase